MNAQEYVNEINLISDYVLVEIAEFEESKTESGIVVMNKTEHQSQVVVCNKVVAVGTDARKDLNTFGVEDISEVYYYTGDCRKIILFGKNYALIKFEDLVGYA